MALECRSCPPGQSFVVAYIAHAPREGLDPLEWPVCRHHALYATIAGWLPLDAVHPLPEPPTP